MKQWRKFIKIKKTPNEIEVVFVVTSAKVAPTFTCPAGRSIVADEEWAESAKIFDDDSIVDPGL